MPYITGGIPSPMADRPGSKSGSDSDESLAGLSFLITPYEKVSDYYPFPGVEGSKTLGYIELDRFLMAAGVFRRSQGLMSEPA